MILGIGNDVVDIERIRAAIERHGQGFIDRCFTKIEQDKANSRSNEDARIATYAKRFAAKEACAKALRTGIGEAGFKDIEVMNDDKGAPSIHLTGGAKAHLEEMTPKGAHAIIHLSLSDEPPYAQAFVVIEARLG